MIHKNASKLLFLMEIRHTRIMNMDVGKETFRKNTPTHEGVFWRILYFIKINWSVKVVTLRVGGIDKYREHFNLTLIKPAGKGTKINFHPMGIEKHHVIFFLLG